MNTQSTCLVIEKLHPPEDGYGVFRYTKIDKSYPVFRGNHKRVLVQDFPTYEEARTYYPRATGERTLF